MPLSHGHSAYEEHEDDVASKFSGKQLQCVTQMIFYSTYTYVEFGRYLSVTLAHEAAQLKHTSAFCRKMFDSRVYTVGKLVAHKAVYRLLAIGKICHAVGFGKMRSCHLIALVLGAQIVNTSVAHSLNEVAAQRSVDIERSSFSHIRYIISPTMVSATKLSRT